MERLDLSYHNSQSMHKKVDSLLERAGKWKTTTLSFQDSQTAKFTIRHRDPVEAIKALWKDPALGKHMVYAPCKVYTNSTRTCRSYSEMWTGQWWNAIQVCKASTLCHPTVLISEPSPNYLQGQQWLQLLWLQTKPNSPSFLEASQLIRCTSRSGIYPRPFVGNPP